MTHHHMLCLAEAKPPQQTSKALETLEVTEGIALRKLLEGCDKKVTPLSGGDRSAKDCKAILWTIRGGFAVSEKID